MGALAGLPGPARALVLAVSVAGAGVLLLALSRAGTWSSDDLIGLGVIAAGVAVSEWFWLPVEHGEETENFSLTEAVFAAGLLLVPPSVLLVGAAAGGAIGLVAQRTAPHKAAFNLGQDQVGLGLAALVVTALGTSPGDVAPADWLACGVAMVAYLAVNEAAVAGVIALVERVPVGEIVLPTLPVTVLSWGGNVALGILAAAVWQADRPAVALLAAPLALSFLAYRSWLRTHEEQKEMYALAEAAAAISAAADLSRRMPEAGRTEQVSALARTLNGMLGRLESAFAREQRFLRDASHELRTPLTVCRGHLDVLGPEPSPPELAATLEVVVEELARMGRIVEDMTTLARSESPGFVRAEPVPLGAFLARLGQKAGTLAGDRLRLTEPAADAVLQADPQRLTQALLNLLQNAVRHTPPGTPIELRALPEAGAWRIEVADHGAGLPPGSEEAVFRPFHRLDHHGPGTGLGLAIVRGIAQAHGGSAGVDNRPGRGATFWVRLPG
ncbi:MAG: HAMP domain-containing histidine kinase [Thermoleophilia bacterium]|nr:HAMP domain-containing histidine kinase [Thermoleophilia bacterium]